MIYLLNLVFQSGLDLNVESQTLGFLRVSAQNHHAPTQARIKAPHALSATEHVWTLRGRPPGRTQGQRLLVPGPVLRYCFCAVDVPEILARHRRQPARTRSSAVPRGFSLSDDFTQHAGQCERHSSVADLCRLRSTLDWPGASPVRQGTVWTGTRCCGLRVRRKHIDLCLSVFTWAPFRSTKVMDWGYLDFARLFVIHEAQAFFVPRAKSNSKF